MRCVGGVATVTVGGLITRFLLPADNVVEMEEKHGADTGDGEAAGHLTPLTISGISKS